MPDLPPIDEVEDQNLLAHMGVDAAKWASAFGRRFTVFKPSEHGDGWDGLDDQWGLMVGWFANAIEAGKLAERIDLATKLMQVAGNWRGTPQEPPSHG